MKINLPETFFESMPDHAEIRILDIRPYLINSGWGQNAELVVIKDGGEIDRRTVLLLLDKFVLQPPV